jgi:hypothetical protein
VGVDLLEDVFGQIVGLQQMAEVQDGRFVRDRFQAEPSERAQRGDLAYFDERDRRFRERDRFERLMLSCVG